MKRVQERSIWAYGAGMLCVIALGLATRRFPELVPEVLGKYPGDALWATVVYFCWAIVLQRAGSGQLFLWSVIASFAVEFSQLYQGEWLVELRSYPIVHLLLGSHFHWPDLVAYAVGAGIGLGLDAGLLSFGRAGR